MPYTVQFVRELEKTVYDEERVQVSKISFLNLFLSARRVNVYDIRINISSRDVRLVVFRGFRFHVVSSSCKRVRARVCVRWSQIYIFDFFVRS